MIKTPAKPVRCSNKLNIRCQNFPKSSWNIPTRIIFQKRWYSSLHRDK